MSAPTIQDIAARVGRYIESEDTDEETFRTLAMEVFQQQYQRIGIVRGLADRTGRRPGELTRWQDIPAVPTAAFKRMPLLADGLVPQLTFESSGTSGSARSQSPYSKAGLELMDRAIRVNAQRMLFPDGMQTRILVLAPP